MKKIKSWAENLINKIMCDHKFTQPKHKLELGIDGTPIMVYGYECEKCEKVKWL